MTPVNWLRYPENGPRTEETTPFRNAHLCPATHARGRKGRFTAGMSAADYQDIIMINQLISLPKPKLALVLNQ